MAHSAPRSSSAPHRHEEHADRLERRRPCAARRAAAIAIPTAAACVRTDGTVVATRHRAAAVLGAGVVVVTGHRLSRLANIGAPGTGRPFCALPEWGGAAGGLGGGEMTGRGAAAEQAVEGAEIALLAGVDDAVAARPAVRHRDVVDGQAAELGGAIAVEMEDEPHHLAGVGA